MRRLRPAIRAYIALVAIAALAAIVAAAALTDLPAGRELLLFGIFLTFASAARLWVVHLSTKMKFTAEDVVTFAAALTLGPLSAMLVGGLSALVSTRGAARKPWFERAFNVSVHILHVGAAAAVFQILAGGRTVTDAPFAAVAAALAHYLVAAVLVDLVVSLQLRRTPLRSLWLVRRRDIGQTGALYVLGALAALLATSAPLTVVLFFLPMLLIVRSLRAATRLREETKQAVFDLADLIDKRDAYTHGHSQRVAVYAERLARHMRLPESQIELVALAARVHDIGKVATPDEVLRKPGPLDARELEVMRRHARDGETLLAKVPGFWEGAALVGAHHERADAAGYPHGSTAYEIPIEAGIIAVADAFDAMTTDRPYRSALGWSEVRAELERGRGTQWDARVVDSFLDQIGMRDGEMAKVPHSILA